MVVIKFSPVYAPSFERLTTLSVKGYELTVNGHVFDFSPLERGYYLDLVDIGSDLFSDRADMSEDGVLTVTLRMTYDEAWATDDIRFPKPVTVTEDCDVDIPTNHPRVIEVLEVESE